MIKRIIRILPNLVIIISLFFIVLWILDIYNPIMNLLGCTVSKYMLIVFFILSIINSIITISLDWKKGEM